MTTQKKLGVFARNFFGDPLVGHRVFLIIEHPYWSHRFSGPINPQGNPPDGQRALWAVLMQMVYEVRA